MHVRDVALCRSRIIVFAAEQHDKSLVLPQDVFTRSFFLNDQLKQTARS